MFKNFSSLDNIDLYFWYTTTDLSTAKKKKKKKKKEERKKKEKKHFFRPPFQRFAPDIPIENKQKKAKQKQNPLKDHFFTSLHTPVHLWILLSARGGTLGKCSYWEGLAYE